MDGDAVDQLARELERDGVVIERALASGEAQDSHDRIAKLIREVPFPVYVALVDRKAGLPDGPGNDAAQVLLTQLQRRIGGSGFYVVATPDGIAEVAAQGLGPDPVEVSTYRFAVGDLLEDRLGATRLPKVVQAEALVRAAPELVRDPENQTGPAVGLSSAEVDELVERARTLEHRNQWRPEIDESVEVRAASPGASVFTGGLIGLVVALLLGQSLRGWGSAGRGRGPHGAGARGVPPAPVLEDERVRARELTDALASELANTDWANLADPEAAERARAAREAAEPLLDSADVGDVIGAQVLARSGSRDLKRAVGAGGEHLTTCFFDPRHPEGTRRVSWRLGDGLVEVPCCTTCRNRANKRKEPHLLRLPRGRHSVAYWERDDVWARTGFGSVTSDLAHDVLTDRGDR